MASNPSPTKKPPTHIRLPQRAESVGGEEQQPGAPPPPAPKPDARTVTQDPVLKK